MPDPNLLNLPTAPTVTLSGDALTGIHTDGPEYLAAVAALPQTVRLGRKPPKHDARARLIHLADYLDLGLRAQALPASTNWRSKAALAIARMYLNDQLGDCVWASNMHLLGVTSANDADSGGIVQATDAEVQAQYVKVCGPGDNGCVITDTLDYGLKTGWTAGGQNYKILGYAAIDWTVWDLCRAACEDFGGFKIGINLPSAWLNSATWDVTNSQIVGGHDVFVADFDADYLYLASWGRIYRMTKAAALSTRWLEEAYVVIAPTWTGPDKKAPSGYDVAGLVTAMAQLRAGQVPSDPTPPTPVPPTPIPPTPIPPVPVGKFRMAGSFYADLPSTGIGSVGTISGTCKSVAPLSADDLTNTATALGVTIPPEVWALLDKYGTIVLNVLIPDLFLVYIHQKTWQQVIADVEAAVLNGSAFHWGFSI